MIISKKLKRTMHSTIIIKYLAIILFLFIVLSTSILAQQSTTGPEPPPNIDNGLREPNKAQVTIPGVPSYIWQHGCAPTAVGMVLGYWDSHGFDNIVEGSATTQTSAVNAMIADDNDDPTCNDAFLDHYRDYSCPIDNSPNLQPDKSETGGFHASNCVADFMETSWSSRNNYYGWSWFSDIPNSYITYINLIAPEYHATALNYTFGLFSWDDYIAEIDAGRPVVLLVDHNGDGNTDHFVTGIGYDDETNEYGVFNTWDHTVHWYEWREINNGDIWGIYGVTTFEEPEPCFEDPILITPNSAATTHEICEDYFQQFHFPVTPDGRTYKITVSPITGNPDLYASTNQEDIDSQEDLNNWSSTCPSGSQHCGSSVNPGSIAEVIVFAAPASGLPYDSWFSVKGLTGVDRMVRFQVQVEESFPRFMDFEEGVDRQPIQSSIPGMYFTTTQGYDWIYGDKSTGYYNVYPYGSGAYHCYGNKFAWLGENQGMGRIDFTGNTARRISAKVSSSTGLHIEAYNSDDQLIANDFVSGNLYDPNLATLSIAAENISYVLIHDNGNYWLIDNLMVDDLLGMAGAYLPAGYSPQSEVMHTVNQGGSFTETFSNPFLRILNFIIHWFGSEMNVQIFDPNGTLYGEYQSTNPPISIFIPSAMPGDWTIQVTAIDVPYNDYPIALIVGAQEAQSVSAMSVVFPDTLNVCQSHVVGDPVITLYTGNLSSDYIASDIDQSSIIVNGHLVPSNTSLLNYFPGFDDEVLSIDIPIDQFVSFYGNQWDTTSQIFSISGQLLNSSLFNSMGEFSLIGHRRGDINGDREGPDISDLTFFVDYLLHRGSAPSELWVMDIDAIQGINISDLVYLVDIIFRGGPNPTTPVPLAR